MRRMSRGILPIAHGEGKFITQDAKTLAALEKRGQVVFRYKGNNPNGSQNAIAGLCNAEGNVVGLMPHPERHMLRQQHPQHPATDASKNGGMGNGVKGSMLQARPSKLFFEPQAWR